MGKTTPGRKNAIAQATETEYCRECDMRQTPKPYHMPKCSLGQGEKTPARANILLEGMTVGKILDYLKQHGPSTTKNLTDAVGHVAWALGRLKDGGHLTSPVRGVWMLPGDKRPIPQPVKSPGRQKKEPAPEPAESGKPPLVVIDSDALKLPAVEIDLPDQAITLRDPSVKLEYVPPPPIGSLEYRIALLEKFPVFDPAWDFDQQRLWYNTFRDCFIGWASYLLEDDDAEKGDQ